MVMALERLCVEPVMITFPDEQFTVAAGQTVRVQEFPVGVMKLVD
jgi:hypothetical protein